MMNIGCAYAPNGDTILTGEGISVGQFHVGEVDGVLEHRGMISVFESLADLISTSKDETPISEVLPGCPILLIDEAHLDIIWKEDVFEDFSMLLDEARAGDIIDSLQRNDITDFSLVVINV